MSENSVRQDDGRSIAELTRELLRNASELVRRELQLAGAELAEKSRRLAAGVALIAVGAVVLLAMLGALTAAAILAFATTLDAWLAALVVSILAGISGGIVGFAGLRALKRATPPVPGDTVESVKEDIEWLKTRAKSASR